MLRLKTGYRQGNESKHQIPGPEGMQAWHEASEASANSRDSGKHPRPSAGVSLYARTVQTGPVNPPSSIFKATLCANNFMCSVHELERLKGLSDVSTSMVAFLSMAVVRWPPLGGKDKR